MNWKCKICKKPVKANQPRIIKFNHMISTDPEVEDDNITPTGRSHTICFVRLESKIKRLRNRIKKAEQKLGELGKQYM